MNPKLAFVIFWGFYLFVLVVSYLVAVSYTFFAPYGLFLIPLTANFCIGYFARDVYTAIKIIIVGFSLQAGILLALLHSSSISEAFFGVLPISSYFTLQVPLGITASLIGKAVSEDRSDIINVCTHVVKKMKQIIEMLLSKVRKHSI